jgi:polyisoprenoid-binding protein YceI
MNNSYLIAVVIVIVAIIGFVFARKSEAPVDTTESEQETAAAVIDGEYDINTASSFVGWKGEFVTGFSEVGKINLNSGKAVISEGSVSGEFVIDMNSITSDPVKDRLIAHLKSDDFFSVEKFPTAKFELRSLTPSSEEGAKEGRYVVGGNLTVKGITKPISFLASFTEDGNTLNINAWFVINRADWEIKYGSATFFKNLGDKVIRDTVEITLDLKATKVIQ